MNKPAKYKISKDNPRVIEILSGGWGGCRIAIGNPGEVKRALSEGYTLDSFL